MTPVSYSVDTSALMDGWIRNYPPKSFPALWSSIENLISQGRLLVSEEVREEIGVHDDSLNTWVDENREHMIVPTDEVVAAEVRRVLVGNERLVMGMKGKNRADPFVIAVARLRGATVVTGEANDGTATRPKIPYVCNQLGIPVTRLLGLIQAEGWTF